MCQPYQPMRQARIEQGLTQKELGQKAGVPYRTLMGYECGHTKPSAYRLGMIAEALGLDARGYPPPPPPRKPLPVKKRNELLEEFMDLPGTIIRDNWPLVAATRMEVEDLNAGHTMVTQEKGRQNRYQMVCGLSHAENKCCLKGGFGNCQTQKCLHPAAVSHLCTNCQILGKYRE